MYIVEASEIPEEEKVYLKKDWFGWRVVEPWKDPINGKINWMNLLGLNKSNIVFLIVITLLSLGFWLGVNELIAQYKLIADNPCLYCSDYASGILTSFSNISIKV